MTPSDRRRRTRVKVKRAVQIDVSHGGVDPQTFHGEMETLSTHGMSLITPYPIAESVKHLTVRIPLPGTRTLVEASVEKIWQLSEGETENRYGLVFSGLRSIDYKAIKEFIDTAVSQNQNVSSRRQRERRVPKTDGGVDHNRRQSSRRWSIPTYPLYINGRDIDTGHYEYMPYADKAIADPKGTSEIMLRIKNGEMPEGMEEYIFARCCVGDDTHNAEAIKAAAEAGKAFGAFPISKRMKIFNDIHRLLLEHKERLLEMFIAEGHPRKLGEWEFSGMLQAFTAETVSFYKTEMSKKRRVDRSEVNLLMRKPDGVVCVSPPRNAASSNSLTGALSLLGGNTLVVKPPLTLPISTMYLWRTVVEEALRLNGAPRGVLNIVVGNTARYLNQWMANPAVNDIVYFGESNRGLDIGNKIYASGKKPILELSGKDLVLIWKDCDIEAASDSLIDCFLGSAQICMVPKMALIHEDIYERFEQVFVKKVKALTVGLPSDPETCLSPVSKIATFYAFLDEAIQKGAQMICGGQRLNYKGEPDAKGVYLEPTLIRLEDRLPLSELQCVREEIFFPLLPLVRLTGQALEPSHRGQSRDDVIFQKMVGLANENAYGLRVSAWAKSDSTIRKLIRAVHHCGLLRINCRHVDFSMYLATHGGPGKTGGPFGELNYFWQRTTHLQGISVRT